MASLFFQIVVAADDVDAHRIGGGVVCDQVGDDTVHEVFGVRATVLEEVVGDRALAPPLGQGGFDRLVLRRHFDGAVILHDFHEIAGGNFVDEHELAGVFADVVHDPAGVDDAEQRFVGHALLQLHLAGGQIERYALAQHDAGDLAVCVCDKLIIAQIGDHFTAVHRFDQAEDLARLRVHVERGAVGQAVDVGVLGDDVAVLIAFQRLGVDDGVARQALEDAADVFQRARQRDGDRLRAGELVEADARGEFQIVVALGQHGLDARVGGEGGGVARIGQRLNFLKQHRGDAHVARAGGLGVDGALFPIVYEEEGGEAVVGVHADAGGVNDLQFVRPDRGDERAGGADEGQIVHGGELAALLARPGKAHQAAAVGNDAADVDIACAAGLDKHLGRLIEAVAHGVVDAAAHGGLHEVGVLHRDAFQRDAGVRAVGDAHFGDEALVVDGVAADRVFAQIQRAGNGVGDGGDAVFAVHRADEAAVFLGQAGVAHAALGNVDGDARRRVADVEAHAGADRHGAAVLDRAVIAAIAAGNAGDLGVRVVAHAAGEGLGVDVDVGAVDVGAIADVDVACGTDRAAYPCGGFANALREGVGIVEDVLRRVVRAAIGEDDHIVIGAQGGVCDVDGVGELGVGLAGGVHVHAEAAAAGVALHVEGDVAEVAADVDELGQQVRRARAGLTDVDLRSQRQVAEGLGVRLVAEAGVVDVRVGVYVFHRSVGVDADVAEAVFEVRPALHLDRGAGGNVRMRIRLADGDEGGVVHARFGVDRIAAARVSADEYFAEVRLDVRPGEDVHGHVALKRVVGVHVAVGNETAPLRGVGARVHPGVGIGEDAHIVRGEEARVDGGVGVGMDGVLAVRSGDADRHGDALIPRVGLGARVVLRLHGDVGGGNVAFIGDAGVGVVIAFGRQGGGIDAAEGETAALGDDGLCVAGVVGVEFHIAGSDDDRRVLDADAAGLFGIGRADICLGVRVGDGNTGGGARGVRRGGGGGDDARIHIHIAGGGGDGRAGDGGVGAVEGVALGVEVAEGGKADAAAVDGLRIGEVMGLRKQGHGLGGEGEALDQRVVLAGGVGVGIVGVAF